MSEQPKIEHSKCEPRKPGVYRVTWGGEVYVSEFDKGKWWLMGCMDSFDESEFDSIDDYLGPVEPPVTHP